MEHNNHFKLIYNLALVTVERLYEPEQEIYEVRFSNEVPPVIIERFAETIDGQLRWDTIPAGNTALAEGIGKLIDEYLQQKNG